MINKKGLILYKDLLDANNKKYPNLKYLLIDSEG